MNLEDIQARQNNKFLINAMNQVNVYKDKLNELKSKSIMERIENLDELIEVQENYNFWCKLCRELKKKQKGV